jgi:hypothetical protein
MNNRSSVSAATIAVKKNSSSCGAKQRAAKKHAP